MRTGILITLFFIIFVFFFSCEEENPAADIINAGDVYLADNAKKEGVIVTDSGLQYEILEKGEGATPAPTDSVTVHYVGKKINGDEFDSSYSRGGPSTFLLSQLISGWVEAIQLMNVGSKYRLVLPPKLAYGPYGSGSVGPNEVLVFEVELLDIITI